MESLKQQYAHQQFRSVVQRFVGELEKIVIQLRKELQKSEESK